VVGNVRVARAVQREGGEFFARAVGEAVGGFHVPTAAVLVHVLEPPLGDVHAAQGLGEVCGTAIECPARIIYQVHVIKDKKITEPEYETEEYYAVTAFGETIDEAAKKAVRYMINHLENEHGLDELEAYALCSLAGDLHIAEVVDHPHMLVCMHMPKGIFNKPE